MFTQDLLKVVESSEIALADVVLTVGLAFILGVLISLVYKKTFKGISYSQTFVNTLAILSPITAIVMLTIGSNLARAFGLVGALSIIRFRTVVKDTKDIAVVFLSLVAGLSVGTQNYHIAIIGTLSVLLFLFILDKYNFGAFSDESFLLSFTVPQDSLNESDYKEIIEKYAEDFELVNLSSSIGEKSRLAITYKMNIPSALKRQNLLAELAKLKGVQNITLISSKNYVDY